ncbi:hypothetical protein [Paenibacillus sp. XY044]|uniref:hypothetical protein n=1 Tax=Paenibacillus sp. XY044 TaxID=2026089 RepID=UPI000B97CEF5|nr:hypothetical protein [Paenibacillus sp. XY044]OZB98015.1 hypothetical protein CJP46_02290 [Paenibacillus sp. XY044]
MISLGIRSDKGTSTANQEVLPVIDARWNSPRGKYYEFSFLNSQACTVIVNGKDKNVLDADQGFQINDNDALIESVVIVEVGIDYKWSGKYGA